MALEGTYAPDTLIGGFQQDLVSEGQTLKNGLNLSRGTLVAIETGPLTATGAAGGGNTGDGTMGAVAEGADIEAGVYALTCLSLTEALAGVGAPDGGNTGNGTIGAIATGTATKEGIYVLTCTALTETPAMPNTGTAAGGNTGNGTCTGVSAASLSIAGTYTLTCIEITAGGILRFAVTDPNGDALEEYVTSGTAYATNHIEFTLTEGGNAWAVNDVFTILCTVTDSLGTFAVVDPDGEDMEDATVGAAYLNTHLGFTITDGGTAFALDDIFNVTVTLTDSLGVFSVFTPSGVRLEDLTVGAAYSNDHFGTTIADGATPFVVGDTFTVTVAVVAGSGHLIAALSTLVNGGQLLHGILAEDADASTGAVPAEVYRKGQFNITDLTFAGADDEDTWRAQGMQDDQTDIYFRTNLAAL